MPRWTTVFAAPYKGVQAHSASSGARRFRVQFHPADESRLLVRMARAPDNPRMSLAVGDEICVATGKTSSVTLSISHVQHMPSWKGNVRTAVITVSNT